MDFFTDKIAERLGGAEFGKATTVYKFARIKAAKAEARAKHPEIPLLDLGVGEPDRPADQGIVAVLAEAAGKAENRFYADNGILEFQEAAAGYLEKVYGVKGLDPRANIMHGIGSKPILAMLPLVLINPGDLLLTTVPGYPVMATYTRYLGGEVYELPLLRENSYYPRLDQIPADVRKSAKLLYLNYPNNPTGQVATRDFYEEVVRFARENQVVVVSDASYAAVTMDDYQPLSFLSVDGAMEVGVEIHSMSKAFNMTGWRLAFLAGKARVIEGYGTVKDNTDSGQFRAIQKAGVYALAHPELTRIACERYSRRFDLLVPVLREVGFDVVKPRASFYCYAPAPKGTRSGRVFRDACEAADFLITEALISTIPWDEAGPYLRFSVTFEAEDPGAEENVITELRRRLLALELVF